ncbi:hypothetical protein GLOIN_2v534159 [Rhizophagus irregularis DAOM 181602=DAOM 197198]|uniref:Uncharacterized protein n=1 Tax=Rhizophagus irregularis (strain DAOM 181602 / DAOM 197198 / MUCL 43194) TaxID=747089 RepID=A0A2P4QNP6_RHIID|nr:hypothetical protein GLOIN_2v534159 [Rhizophagus irregularis DAOM 181602=DAOM 197198]POG79252.1 hypothetical protein GLOIN_2v534159 [Rhizophagus irregularis DAOM 181602=DAOM 197198]|eukprot:XP_025186118.1 hypothetical protein GLOIN_2v534159 [Rhizophagus irregularis DAOM 181602=DAOM 197198]
MFRKKYSESQHPLLQLFNNEELQDNVSDSSPTGSYRNPTITIPPVNINLMPHMEDSPSRTITRAHFQSNYLVPKTKDSNSDSGSIDSRLSSSSRDGSKSPLSSSFNLDSTPSSQNLPSKPEVTKNATSEKQESSSPVSKIISPTQSLSDMTRNGLLSPVSITNGKGPVRQESGYFSVQHKSNISVEITNPTIDKINSPANAGSNSGGLLTPPLSSLAMSKSDHLLQDMEVLIFLFPIMSHLVYLSIDQVVKESNILLKLAVLAVNLPRQRATSVSHMQQRSPKPKFIAEENGSSSHLLTPSPLSSKFNQLSLQQNSPTRSFFTGSGVSVQNTSITSATLLNSAGPELKPLKMDKYRGNSEVYEDLAKTTDDLLQWLTLLDAGISQLLTRF